MNKIRVLVFDDEISEIGKLFIGLLDEKFLVEVTMNPQEIVSRFKRMRPNVVIVNHDVAEFNATEVCKTVKEHSNIPIILLLHKDSPTTMEIDSCNADEVIFKPVNVQALAALIKHLHAVQN